MGQSGRGEAAQKKPSAVGDSETVLGVRLKSFEVGGVSADVVGDLVGQAQAGDEGAGLKFLLVLLVIENIGEGLVAQVDQGGKFTDFELVL